MIYVIMVWTTLHQLVGVLPERFPDKQSCDLALAQTQFAAFNWGQCVPLGFVPKLQHKYHHSEISPRAAEVIGV